MKRLPIRAYALLALAAGCAVNDKDDPDTGELEAIGEGPTVPRDGSLPEHMTWPGDVAVRIDRGCREARCRVGSIAVTVTNRSSHPASISVWLRGDGLDGREARIRIDGRTSGEVELGGGQIRRLLVPASSLPIQSVGTLSGLTAEVATRRGQVRTGSLSSPLAIEHDPAYQQVFTHDTAGALARGGELDPAVLARPVGRVWVTDRFVDVATLPPVDPGARLGGGTTTTRDDRRAARPLARPAAPIPGPSVDRQVCFLLKARYVDAGFGEDRLGAPPVDGVPAVQLTPASYLKAELVGPGPNWAGRLDADGCTPVVPLEEDGSWKIVVHAEVSRVIDGEAHTVRVDSKVYVEWERWFSVGTGAVIHASPVAWDLPQNVTAMVIGLIGQGDGWFPAGETVIRADRHCPSGAIGPDEGGSCVRNQDIWLSEETDESPAHAEAKYLSAHQVGHLVEPSIQLSYSGLWFSVVDTIHDLCRCAQLDPDHDDQCTQSLEQYAAALYEGFADFTAAAAFNDPTGPDCNMADNLPLHILFGVIPAPAPIDCAMDFEWRDTYCDVEPDTATRLDFVRFFWRLHTQGSHALTIDQIVEVISRATLIGEVTFSTLTMAAADVLSAGELDNLVDLADQASVD